MNRHMTVNYMTIGGIYTKSIQYHIGNLFIIAQLEVVSLLLMMRFLVAYEIALEGCHLGFIKQRTVLATPQIEEIIYRITALIRHTVALESGTNKHSDIVHEFLSAKFPTGENLDFLERAVGIKRNGCVIEQIAVVDGIHTTVAQ